MKRIKVLFLASVLFLLPALALATDIGTNITVYDGAGSGSGWHRAGSATDPVAEDQEVEAGCEIGQQWDLEGFFLQGNILSLVGGFDFAGGEDDFFSGDIFLDTDGSLSLDENHGTGRQSGDGYLVVDDNFGYEYAINLDFAGGQYTVYDLRREGVQTSTVYYRQNDFANPWRYVGGGESVAGAGGNFTYTEAIADTGFAGATHNLVTGIDLGFLGHGTGFTAHFTMGCGNDNLAGQGVVTPEPTTFLLLGLGFLGLAAAGRRRLSSRNN